MGILSWDWGDSVAPVLGLPHLRDVENTDPNRFNVADLRVRIAEARHRQKRLEEFRGLWDEFMRALWPLVQARDGQPWAPNDPLYRPKVLMVEIHQMDLRSRIPTAFGKVYPSDPLASFIGGNIWGYDDPRFVRLIEGTVAVEYGEPQTAVVPRRFETKVADSNSIITEHQLAVAEELRNLQTVLTEAERLEQSAAQALKDQRDHELAVAAPSPRTWIERRSKQWPWRWVWPFVQKPLLNVLWLPILGGLIALWRWLRLLLGL